MESGDWRFPTFKKQEEFRRAKSSGEDTFEGFRPKLKRNDMRTWENKFWPVMADEGILGAPAVLTKQAFMNRVNDNVYQVFAQLTGESKLWVNIDRYGFFRPTKGIQFDADSVPEDRPRWKSVRNVHFDRNPWEYFEDDYESNSWSTFSSDYNILSSFSTDYNSAGHCDDGIVKLQGLINLVDNRAEDGGFHIIPQFHKYAKQWAKATKHTLGRTRCGGFIVLPKTDPLDKLAQRVTVRAGSMVVWDNIMPHGSAPNDSDRVRLAQFIKMFPAPNEIIPSRKMMIEAAVQETNTELNDVQRKILGLDPW